MFGVIAYRGFCLGYTISSFISVLGISKGLAFIASNIMLHNIVLIPAILAIGVSGLKLHKSIIKDKRRENIKIEIVRHICFSLAMMLIMILSSVIEVLISDNILKIIIKYF